MKFRYAVLLAALAGTGNAMAHISANASMNGVRYELFDLDPGDGITPSLTLQPSAALGFNSSASVNAEPSRENRRDRASSNLVHFEAQASAVANPPLPVPEAPTVAMLFAGLGVLLLRIRHPQGEA